MRRLTLILSDLYLPEEAQRGMTVPTTRHLPNLEWLLRFAESPEHVERGFDQPCPRLRAAVTLCAPVVTASRRAFCRLPDPWVTRFFERHLGVFAGIRRGYRPSPDCRQNRTLR